MFSDTEEAQVITLRALFELWRNHQQMMVVLVDKLLKTQIAEELPKLSNNTNGYIIKSIEAYNSNEKFGIEIGFERNYVSQSGILINYHLICAMLVLVASINFVFNAKDTNRSCILVALLLVLATFFSDAQVCNCYKN